MLFVWWLLVGGGVGVIGMEVVDEEEQDVEPFKRYLYPSDLLLLLSYASRIMMSQRVK